MPSATELRELDDDELEEHLAEYRRELLNLRFQLATGQLDNPARVGQVRRDIARVLTLLRDREIALAEGFSPSTGRAGPVEPAIAAAPRRARRTNVEEDVADDDGALDDATLDDEVVGTSSTNGEDE